MNVLEFYPTSMLMQTNTLLMSIKMSMTMGNTTTGADVTLAPNNTPETNGQSFMLSDLPPLNENDDINTAAGTLKASEQRRAQIKRLLTQTWLRVVIVIALIVMTILVVVLARSASPEPVYQSNGVASNSINLSNTPTGRDNLNPAQAEYLMQIQREEAAEKADSGVTNAAVIELPRASVQGVDANEVSNASAFRTDKPKNYYEASDATEKPAFDLTSQNNRFVPAGQSHIDEETNQLAVQRAAAQANSRPSPAGTPNNATYNTAQNNNPDPSVQNGGNNGGNGTNGGGSNDGSTAAVADQPIERQPDPDLPLVQQRLFDSYNQQQLEQEMYAQRLNEIRQANIAQAQQLEQQRRQLAAQSIAEQMQSQQSKSQGNSFSSKSYKPKPVEDSSNNGSGSGNTGTNSSQNYYEPSKSGFIPSAYSNNSSYSNQSSNNSNQSQPPKLLDKNIVRAGTSYAVVITKEVNTDEGLGVIGKIVGGRFDGSTVHGQVQPSGRNVGVLFTRIEPPNPRKPIIPVNALAQTLGSQKQAVASKVKNHYVQNYSISALESIIGGYGDAYSNQNEVTIDQGDGTVITSKGETTQKEVTANILSRFSERLSSDVTRAGDRPPTFIISQGTVLNMVLLSNLDVHSTTNDVVIGSASSGARTSL